jgi:hypothetical protein
MSGMPLPTGLFRAYEGELLGLNHKNVNFALPNQAELFYYGLSEDT